MLDATEHLVEKVGHPLMVQVHVDHLAKVGIHQFHHNVEIEELLEGLLRGEAVEQPDDVLVVD